MKGNGRKTRAERPEPQVHEDQCLYCSLYFQDVAAHQRLVHKGDKPSDPIPEGIEGFGPGTIVRPPSAPGRDPQPPYKVPWTNEWVDKGYECRACPPGMSRYMGPREKCDRCGMGPVTKMFEKVEFEPPRDMDVGFGQARYHLVANQVNLVPSIIRDVARQSLQAEREPLKPKQDSDFGKLTGVRRLETVGFLPSLEEDKSF